MSEAWRNGSTKEWRKTRQRVLDRNAERNEGRCQLAYPGEWSVVVRIPREQGGGSRVEQRRCTGVATQAHHKLGRAVTGDDPRYLIATCEPCNLHAGDPSTAADPVVVPLTRW